MMGLLGWFIATCIVVTIICGCFLVVSLTVEMIVEVIAKIIRRIKR